MLREIWLLLSIDVIANASIYGDRANTSPSNTFLHLSTTLIIMSFRPGLFSNAFRQANFSRTFQTFNKAQARSLPLSRTGYRLSPLFPLAIGATYLTYSSFQPVRCESATMNALGGLSGRPVPEVGGGELPPQSSLSGYQLGFGAVCGICAGVFVKKGLKALAFMLGGVFVLMQVSPLYLYWMQK